MRTARPKKSKKTAFVPRSVFLTVLATTSVVPLVACGGSVGGGGSGADSGTDARAQGVAADAFVGVGVAFRGFDAVATVARVGFDGAFGVATDAFAGVADVAFRSDALLGVAVGGFEAGMDAPAATVAACCFDGSVPPNSDGGK
jgi:hypothetical protein